MKAPPLVSIVTPSFNQGRFLRRTIESVLNQSYPHIEYLVLDGGSTDHSVEILRSYGDRFYWVSEKDNGQADAINKGFARCRGEIRAYLNSDDVLLSGAVETVVAHFQSHPDWLLLYGRAHHIDEEDRVIGSYPTKPFSLKRLAEESCICQPAAFWRVELTRRIGPFNPQLDYCMDYEYWLRAARSGSAIVHVEDLLACSRLYPETKTMSGRVPMFLECMRVCQEQMGYVPRGPFIGLWHHICRERWQKFGRIIGGIPGVPHLLAKTHHLWWKLGFTQLSKC